MLNIGIDIRPLMSPIRAGVGEYTHELLSAIFKLDKENQYWLFYNSYNDVSQNIPNWSQENVHYIHTKWPNKLFNASVKIFGLPKTNKGNLDYFFLPNFNFTALPKKIKQILTVHDLSFEFFPQFFSFKQRLWHWAINPKKQCRKADIILTPSENTKRDIVNFYKIQPEKIKVIYPGFSSQFSHFLELPEKIKEIKEKLTKKYNLPYKFILFLGSIEPRKNVIGLIEAFEKLCSTTLNYSLVIAGYKGWKNKKIYEKLSSSPVKEKIKFIGSVDAIDKPDLYSISELFVYPSFYEGFGFPVLEAMACGVPVITSNRSSLVEITDSAAYLINPDRPEEIADAMKKLTSDEKLREHFKKMGLEQVKKFSWERAAREFISLLN